VTVSVIAEAVLVENELKVIVEAR